jgi:hypothetical protein
MPDLRQKPGNNRRGQCSAIVIGESFAESVPGANGVIVT